MLDRATPLEDGRSLGRRDAGATPVCKPEVRLSKLRRDIAYLEAPPSQEAEHDRQRIVGGAVSEDDVRAPGRSHAAYSRPVVPIGVAETGTVMWKRSFQRLNRVISTALPPVARSSTGSGLPEAFA